MDGPGENCLHQDNLTQRGSYTCSPPCMKMKKDNPILKQQRDSSDEERLSAWVDKGPGRLAGTGGWMDMIGACCMHFAVNLINFTINMC